MNTFELKKDTNNKLFLVITRENYNFDEGDIYPFDLTDKELFDLYCLLDDYLEEQRTKKKN